MQQLSLFLLALMFVQNLLAAPLTRDQVPEPLKTWVPWVLHGNEVMACPILSANSEARICLWPGNLRLSLDAQGGKFSLDAAVYVNGWLPLPGDAKNWPQGLLVNGKAHAVNGRDGLPGVLLNAGDYTLSGNFLWRELPQDLAVPRVMGLVSLNVNGNAVAQAAPDEAGRLWLGRVAKDEANSSALELHVSRLLDDDVPMLVTTRYDIIASGKGQELILPNAVLAGFTPLAINSNLPARLDAENRLHVQVRPGTESIEVVARSQQALKQLALPKNESNNLPSDEVWVFKPHNELRMLTVQGVTAVDPKQTTIPPSWQQYPTYHLKRGDVMRFNVTRVGNPDPAPDKLALQRNIWLDFDGSGYTLQDQLSGTINRAWRLDMREPQHLGRAAISGVDQFITSMQAGTSGIEVRQGNAQITADSRIADNTRTLSATGWALDVNQLGATLNLPPGWQLLHVSGADRAVGSWVAQWTLLDFFLLLITALVVSRLLGRVWGFVTLLMLVLVYQVPDAPTWVWLNLLAVLTLLRVLPLGQLRNAALTYRWLALAAVVLVLVPFAVQQVRQTLYPVLEKPYWSLNAQAPEVAAQSTMSAAAPVANMAMDKAESGAATDVALEAVNPQDTRAGVRSMNKSDYAFASKSATQSYQLQNIDPNVITQTGPGLPAWHWNSYQLIWKGPVEQTQQIRLWLISPAVNAFITALRLILLISLLIKLFNLPLAPASLRPFAKAATEPEKTGHETTLASFVLSSMLLAAYLLFSVPNVYAATSQGEPVEAGDTRSALPNTPSEDILNQLREKLLAAPDCLPNCAELARMRVLAAGDSLQLRLEAHLTETAAIALPGGAGQWSPQRVAVDGKPAHAMMRDENGVLWLLLQKGVHQISLESSLASSQTVSISLPQPLHRVESDLKGWILSGVNEEGIPGGSLQLTRLQQTDSSQANNGAPTDNLPPFVRVERIISLGLTWQIETHIVRVGPGKSPVQLEIPLLAGESVTSADIKVEQGKALINLGAQSNEASFSSSLKIAPQFTLKASLQNNQIQLWQLKAETLWHVSLQGIPLIHQQSAAQEWSPQWQPWPGESATVQVSKPAGVPGQTLTVDSADLHTTPGIRAADVRLLLALRSSRGGQHVIKLPANALLQSVKINGREEAARLENAAGKAMAELYLPLTPGAQNIEIIWREPRGLTTLFNTSALDIGAPGVNVALHLALPEDRWLLLVGGSRMGPAVLFWGVFVVLTGLTFVLGRRLQNTSLHTPLGFAAWFLLGLGLTQSSLIAVILIAGWFFVLAARKTWGETRSGAAFNLMQVLLALWTFAAMLALFAAVWQGLLGQPDMQIAGNGSHAGLLNWYLDRSASLLPQAWAVTISVMFYRGLMLLWALWLAWSLLNWVRWGWDCYSTGGYWKKSPPRAVVEKKVIMKNSGEA
ncbi:MAG: hypothetical protein HOP04_02850 [Methylophilaceae bacterium]|nr:hypothetical protein [Methylophilaceae bacterium]